MKVLFKNKTKYSKETYYKFIKFHNIKYGFKYKFYTILIIILLIYCAILTFSKNVWGLGITFTLITILFTLYRFFEPISLIKKELKSKAISKEKTFIFKFYENYFKIVDGMEYTQVSYLKLKKVFELNDFFYLYIDKSHAFLISKNGFTYKTAEEFSNFIKRKCWYKFTRIKKDK